MNSWKRQYINGEVAKLNVKLGLLD